MPTLKSLKDQGLALVAQQKQILDDKRPWPQKQADFDRVDADLKAVMTQFDAMKGLEAAPFGGRSFDGLADRDGGGFGAASALARAYGAKAVGSPRIELAAEQVEELREAALSMKSLAIDCKAATDSTSITPAGISQYVLPPYTMRREPTRVLDLLPKTAAEHPIVTYYTTTGTTAAAAVAEGATKPQSTIAYTPVTATMTKVAHYAEVTDETLQDFAGFMQVLEADMMAGLIKAENAEVLTATVTGAHKFAGLLNASGILTRVFGAGSETVGIDTISLAFDDLRNGTSYAEPDGIVMNPSDWGKIRRLKDAQGRYIIEPDPTQSAALSLWGKPVVLTTQITAGTALVGNFSEGAIAFIRDGIRVEVANQGTAQFTANTTLARCEERLTVGVVRPTCFVKVTGL